MVERFGTGGIGGLPPGRTTLFRGLTGGVH